MLRTADAFGAGVALSPECADPTGPRALRASAGAIFRVPLVAWDELPERGSRSSHTAATPLAEAYLEPPLTLLLGSEREGLPESLVTDVRVTIPPGRRGVLNVAAAGAIALYELGRRAGSDDVRQRATIPWRRRPTWNRPEERGVEHG